MGEDSTVQTVVAKLHGRGRPPADDEWVEGNPNYVGEYALNSQHIPGLISLATEWGHEQPGSDVVYGAIRAWRALGQLRAVEAVQPLLDIQDRLDELKDDWYLEEFPGVFGLIGPPAVNRLATFLADDSHRKYPRSIAGNGLREIALRFPESRNEIVAILTSELSLQPPNEGDLNGFLLGDLLDLNAKESAEAIERAFAANAIDPTIAGDWGDVRTELNIPGLGLAPDRSPGWPSLRERLGFPEWAPQPPRRKATRRIEQDAIRKEKAKRKEKKKQKKRNRKSR